jgi:hypothetical protein
MLASRNSIIDLGRLIEEALFFSQLYNLWEQGRKAQPRSKSEMGDKKFDWDAAIAGLKPKRNPKPQLISPEFEPEHEILRNQFYCINGNTGYAWMVSYMPSYDGLPRIVREQLQQSPFNICTMCLTSCLPRTAMKARGRRADDLLMCVEIREHQIRSGRP